MSAEPSAAGSPSADAALRRPVSRRGLLRAMPLAAATPTYVLVVLFALLLATSGSSSRFETRRSDSTFAERSGTRQLAIRDGRSPYPPPVESAVEVGNPALYPPFLMLLVAPLTFLPWWLGLTIWTLLQATRGRRSARSPSGPRCPVLRARVALDPCSWEGSSGGTRRCSSFRSSHSRGAGGTTGPAAGSWSDSRSPRSCSSGPCSRGCSGPGGIESRGHRGRGDCRRHRRALGADRVRRHHRLSRPAPCRRACLFGAQLFGDDDPGRAGCRPRWRAAAALAVGVAIAAAAFYVGRRVADEVSISLAVLAAILGSPIVWEYYYALLLVPVAIVRPRFSGLWMMLLLFYVAHMLPRERLPKVEFEPGGVACCKPQDSDGFVGIQSLSSCSLAGAGPRRACGHDRRARCLDAAVTPGCYAA